MIPRLTSVSIICTRCWAANLNVGHMLLTGMDDAEQYRMVVGLAAEKGWTLQESPDGQLQCLCPKCIAQAPKVEALPAFQSQQTCPKCGAEGMTIRYCCGGPPPACMANRAGEHLHRTCPQCRYDMLQRTKDKTE